jgi:hypothetical protein
MTDTRNDLVRVAILAEMLLDYVNARGELHADAQELARELADSAGSVADQLATETPDRSGSIAAP